jgi:hypothetical protein
MVTKKDIKDYDFKNMDQYFDYVLESIVNGQRQQAKNLISCFSQRQRNQFAMYLENGCFFPLEHKQEAKQMAFAGN